MKIWIWIPAVAFAIVLLCAGGRADEAKIPILHITDLFHPHHDPDDHFDLACLFALKEFDIRGIILDNQNPPSPHGSKSQSTHGGWPAVEQMMHITGRKAPCAIGLRMPLQSLDDKALDGAQESQGGVQLLLSALRDSKQKVVINLVGSCNDLAAALNREPELLKDKVQAVYVHAGNGPGGPQNEYNVEIGRWAYLRLMRSELPIYWSPCFGSDNYQTHYLVQDQSAVMGTCTEPVQNFFVYCLTQSKEEPLGFLASGPHSLPTGARPMFCTAPMLHAAGRKIYQRGDDDFVALSPADAQRVGIAGKSVDVCEFIPMRVQAGDNSVGKPGEPVADMAKPEPGKLSAVWIGLTEDRVGTAKAEPDGLIDCCVRILGVPADKPINNIILTGPNKGRWEYVETGSWWRLAFDRQERWTDVYFQFYAAGEHRVEIIGADETSHIASFVVPNAETVDLRVELLSPKSRSFVFRTTDTRYQQILVSCLKNLLAELGR